MRKSLAILAALFLSLAFSLAARADGKPEDAVARLQHEWAVVNYQVLDDRREAAFKTLADMGAEALAKYPNRADVLIWDAIILSGYAKEKGGLGALDLVKQARERLLAAEKIDPNALNGSTYTTLGSLYYKVPGWPISFGDKDKARGYLEKALAINPEGIDPNYFYGDFLLEQGNYAKAAEHLKKALSAPPRPGREDADAGRRAEARQALRKAEKYL